MPGTHWFFYTTVITPVSLHMCDVDTCLYPNPCAGADSMCDDLPTCAGDLAELTGLETLCHRHTHTHQEQVHYFPYNEDIVPFSLASCRLIRMSASDQFFYIVTKANSSTELLVSFISLLFSAVEVSAPLAGRDLYSIGRAWRYLCLKEIPNGEGITQSISSDSSLGWEIW